MKEEIKYFFINVTKIEGGWQIILGYAGFLLFLFAQFLVYRIGVMAGKRQARRSARIAD